MFMFFILFLFAAYPKFLFDRLDFTYEFVNDAVMFGKHMFDETLPGIQMFDAID